MSSVQLCKTASDSQVVPFKKTSDEQQVVFGEVYAPGFPDSQGDFMTKDTIQTMAYGFLKKANTSKIDVQHSREECGAYVVESFIARDDDPVFIPGSWVVGVKVPDTNIWEMVKSGELNGFSLDGLGVRVPTTIELTIPEVLKGETDVFDGHGHDFHVRFDEEGNFLGGKTSKAEDGHFHEINRGTATEVTDGHSHRFSFVEGVIDAQIAN
jgi:hypothetical protein